MSNFNDDDFEDLGEKPKLSLLQRLSWLGFKLIVWLLTAVTTL
jgi:hypothetical protein